MRTALDGLWTMWEISRGKSNNWKVFIGSKEISPDDVGRSSRSRHRSDSLPSYKGVCCLWEETISSLISPN